ncbi:MAG TPA: sugar phosphate nucleotidyltransferase [Fimbriimonadaceae bacterium]|nr:sugar phosphate nucleotidyltransferase [Fimbriimonadaceae bacterium]
MSESVRVAVILAGGSGERFWPLSTPERPKQLLALSGSDKTLLQEAIERAEPIFGHENVFVATGPKIGQAIKESGLIEPERVFVEPEAKNTLGAILWAVSELAKRGYGDEAEMAVLTADHAIGHGFQITVEDALSLARFTEGLVTIGIKPTRAETGYGYIHVGEHYGHGYRVRQFAEKPSTVVAEEYVRSGDFYWNSGMFFWTVGAFRSELSAHAPDAAAILAELDHDSSRFSDLHRAPIDKALMEKSDKIYVVPAQFTWDDVGSWDSLARTNEPNDEGNVLIGPVAEVDSNGCIVYSEGVALGVLGVSDLIVVATKSGVLVCHKSEAQRVKELLGKLQAG